MCEERGIEKEKTAQIISVLEKNNNIELYNHIRGDKKSNLWYNMTKDSTYSVRAYSTIYWNEYEDQDEILYGNLEKVIGGWQILDSRVYLSNRHVINGQYGWTMTNRYKQYSQNKYPSSNTYSYTTPSSWLPVKFNPSAPPMELGSTSNVTITFGSNSWSFQFTNNYND